MNHAKDNNSRRLPRFSLALPVRVESRVSESHAWDEITRLTDVSAFGAGFNLKRPVKRGRRLQMTLTLPRQLRCYDFAEPQYKIWGLVRSCITRENFLIEERYSVGIAFIGKHPPQSFYEEPAKLFEISHKEEGTLWNIIDAPTRPDESDLQKTCAAIRGFRFRPT